MTCKFYKAQFLKYYVQTVEVSTLNAPRTQLVKKKISGDFHSLKVRGEQVPLDAPASTATGRSS